MKKRCSKCGKRIRFWQNRWSLSEVNKKPHDYWHTKCARPLHELVPLPLKKINNYLYSITNFVSYSYFVGDES